VKQALYISINEAVLEPVIDKNMASALAESKSTLDYSSDQLLSSQGQTRVEK
jgi:hypothetical protein